MSMLITFFLGAVTGVVAWELFFIAISRKNKVD